MNNNKTRSSRIIIPGPIIIPGDVNKSESPPNNKTPADSQEKEVNPYASELQYIAFIALISLSILGLLSLIQLVFIGVGLDLVILYKTESLEYSLLLLPLQILDYLGALKKKDSSLLEKVIGFLTVTVFALGWAAAETVLTLHFLPELIGFIGSSMGVIVPLLHLKVAVIAAATFAIIFLLGQKNLEKGVCKNIINKNSNKSIKVGKILLFGFMYFLIIGCAREWIKYFILYMPSTLAIVVTTIAGLTFAHFIAKRVNETVDEASKSIAISSWLGIAKGVLSYAAICALIFSFLHIISFSWSIVIIASAFIVIEAIGGYVFNDINVFENLYDRICLLAHGAGESLVPTAGMQGVMPGFMLPFWALALTVFEVLEDSNHEHKEDRDNYELPNLKKLGVSVETIYEYVKNREQLISLGYEETEDKKSPGMGFATNLARRKEIMGLIKNLKNKDFTITVEQAIRLIFVLNHKIVVKNLYDAGFDNGEIIGSKLFSKKQLEEYKITPKEDYKADLTPIMIQNLAKNGEINIKNLEDAGFSESEIVGGNVFTDKQLLDLGFECDYYSSQLSFALMLTLVSLIFVNYNPISLAVGLIVSGYYFAQLYSYNASTELKFSRLANHFTYYASYITAFSLGVNGGVECLNVFGSGIGVAIALAIFGAIIESSVYFNELMNDDGSHVHGSILDCIPSFENCMLYFSLFMVCAGLCKAAILFNLPIVLLSQVDIIVLPLIFKANYDQIHAKAVSLLNNTNGEFSVSAMIILINAVFLITSIIPALGYIMVFIPIPIPIMVIVLNALLLLLVNKQGYTPLIHVVSINSIINKFDCGCKSTQDCPSDIPGFKKNNSFSDLLTCGLRVAHNNISINHKM